MKEAAHMFRARRLATVIPVIIAIAFAAMYLLSGFAQAASGPKVVRGYIRDNEGTVLQNADVTINILYPDTSLRSTLSDTSDSSGFYSVTFGNSDWDIGNTIQVIATYSSNQERNSTLANANPVQYVNVTYPYVIDEFGSALGLIMAGGAIAAVAAVFLVFFRRR